MSFYVFIVPKFQSRNLLNFFSIEPSALNCVKPETACIIVGCSTNPATEVKFNGHIDIEYTHLAIAMCIKGIFHGLILENSKPPAIFMVLLDILKY